MNFKILTVNININKERFKFIDFLKFKNNIN